MKNAILAFTTAVAMMFASAAVAEGNRDFRNNTFELIGASGAMDFTLRGDGDGFTEAEVGATFFSYSVGALDADIRAAFRTDLNGEIGLRGEYILGSEVQPDFTLYGIAAIEYVTRPRDLGNGDFLFDPTVGALYRFNETVALFGEVSYTWNMSDSFGRRGGLVEVGLPLSLNHAVTLTPSVTRTFDTGRDATNLNLSMAFVF